MELYSQEVDQKQERESKWGRGRKEESHISLEGVPSSLSGATDREGECEIKVLPPNKNTYSVNNIYIYFFFCCEASFDLNLGSTPCEPALSVTYYII